MSKEALCPICSTTDYSRIAHVMLKPLQIMDECLYEIPCPHGSVQLAHLQGFKFALLYESGIRAMRDKYYREAVTSFSVSLERFYEFSIAMLLVYKLGPQETGNFDEQALKNYAKLWGQPLKLSERQLGAFYGLYFSEFGESPVLFDQSYSKSLGHKLVTDPVNFRNNTTHAGYIPSYEEALEYGEAVKSYIWMTINKFSEKDSDKRIPRIHHVTFLELALAFLKRREPSRSVPPLVMMNIFLSTYKESLADYTRHEVICDSIM